MRCKPQLAKQDVVEVPAEVWQDDKIVTSTTGIFAVVNVLYFNLSGANEHVLEIKETLSKFQEYNYLSWQLA